MKRGVIGIDPSLTATGIAHATGLTTTTPDKDGDYRLHRIFYAVQLAAEVADLAIVEDLPTHGMGAGKTGMAQGVVRMALIEKLVPYVTVPAASLKVFATGRGGATKADMRMELYKRADLDIRDDNQVDAWWLRQLGLHWMGLGEIQLPALHTRALDKIDFSSVPVGVRP